MIQTNLDNQKKLLLLKDSYADCMVPFLAQHYSEICILDVMEMEHSLSELAEVSDYTQVLILCDADTFAEQETAAVFTEERKMIDLHIHTTCSDGQFSPEETIRMAHQAGVTVAAVTDHDTVSGIVAASAAAVACGMTFSGH